MTIFDENPNYDVYSAHEYKSSRMSKNSNKMQYGRRYDDPENRPQKNPFIMPLCFILAFAVVEFYTGVWSQSLALLSDAWHMFSDVFAISLAMLAFGATQKARTKPNKKVGASFELIASIMNAVLMFTVIGWVANEAWVRFANPTGVQSGAVIAVATIGLLVNLFVARYLHNNDPKHVAAHYGHHHQHLNHQAALLHVIGDILGSIAALVSGIIIYFTGWAVVDPILSMVIVMLLLIGTLSLCRDIVKSLR